MFGPIIGNVKGYNMQSEPKDVLPSVGKKKVKEKKEARSEFLRIPDLTPADVQEALLDWLKRHQERWGKK